MNVSRTEFSSIYQACVREMAERMAELRPEMSRYAYVYGVALHETGEIQRALQVLTEAHRRHPADRDILVALVEYHRQTGDRQAAIVQDGKGGVSLWVNPVAV